MARPPQAARCGACSWQSMMKIPFFFKTRANANKTALEALASYVKHRFGEKAAAQGYAVKAAGEPLPCQASREWA